MLTVRIRSLALVILACALVGPSPAAAVPDPPFHTDCDSLGPPGTPFVRGVNCRIVDVQDYPRQYIVYVPRSPAFDLTKETAVVFHYHGTGGTAEGMLTGSQWTDKAEESRFVAVFGTGLTYFECFVEDCSAGEITTKWHNVGLECGEVIDCSYEPPGYPDDADWPADDVAFTDRMIADVTDGLVVDPRRIHLSGFSNGAAMALTLAVARSQVFASVASAGAGPLALGGVVHHPVRSMPVFYVVGDRDGHIVDEVNEAPDAPEPPITSVPLTYDEAFTFSAVRYRVDLIAATFGVSNVPDHAWEFPNELRVRFRSPLAGIADPAELLVSFQGGVRHAFANANENPEGFHDPDLFWKFFHDHPLPK